MCNDGDKQFDLDARPSDAIAIGLRFNVPIYTVESVLSEAGIILSDLEDEDEESELDETSETKAESKPASEKKEKITETSVEDLNKLLTEALEKEDYERAAKIRDEIQKRGK